jgi:hypothetical protein
LSRHIRAADGGAVEIVGVDRDDGGFLHNRDRIQRSFDFTELDAIPAALDL